MTKIKTFHHNLWDHGISQGYSVDNTIYISGQFSYNQEGQFTGTDDIEAQTRLTFENLDRILKEFNVTKNNLAYVELYLTKPEAHFDTVINMYKEYIGTHRPAGSLIGVTYLAFPEQLIEISAVAHTD
ncbi:RidA family protein [Metabacillus malikii]|uniref:Enamine deaminase RidA (YjgF/YER057c/UK114 family) n=1 Tax=Metabacillus malikii TaxID=1504265 RepID=A0ABT9ZBG6_9BACI|nr:RidA family protein [Metabacillus malikii]MDQ0229177.1 enamine deaminase RidA (YjgF/YER057c/UK114 family) [Metabacillus malikii]